MSDTDNKTRRTWRLAPCPDYDVEGMESWLADMAADGLFLAKDGFFADVATFEKATPKKMLYRLEASQNGSGMWADNWGEPDSEALELHEKYRWTYLAKRGEFYIYCTESPAVRELNTDPEVQALALNVIRKRQLHNILSSLIFFGALPILRKGGTYLVTSAIAMGTWFFLFTVLLCLWLLIGNLHKIFTLQKLQKKLRSGQTPQRSKNWKKRAALHHASTAVQIAGVLLFFVIALGNWADDIMEKDIFPLEEYPGDPPFVTIADLAGEGAHDYRLNMVGMGLDGAEMFSDPLALLNVEWNEHAEVTAADGRKLDAALYVNYHCTAGPALARRLAKEYLQYAKQKHGYEPWELPDLSQLGVDYAAGYLNAIHQPSIILQKGNVVAHISFSQYGEDYNLSPEEWITAMAAGLA